MLTENSDYLNSFEKADAWIGPADTAHFLQEEIRKKYEKSEPVVSLNTFN
jgi:hypothetical protein